MGTSGARGHRPLTTATLLLAVAFVAGGCSDDAPRSESARTPDASPTSTATAPAPESDAPAERPSLDEIMSDGRYTFTPLSAQQQEGLEQAAIGDAGAAEDVEEVRGAVVRQASGDDTYVLLMAFDYSEEAAASPDLWESFQRGVSLAIGAEMQEASVAGAEAAYQKASDLHTLLIRYGPDLVFSLSSPLEVSRPELEDVARYLLRDRP